MIAMPTAEGRVSSPFGWRMLGSTPDWHGGIDFVARAGTPIYAVHAGTVVNVWPNGALSKYGTTIVIKHDLPADAPYALYAHLGNTDVTKGQHVGEGQRIASSGNTAASKENASRTVPPHLHFELLSLWPPPKPDAYRVDPSSYLGLATAKTGFGLGAVAGLLGLLWWLRRSRK